MNLLDDDLAAADTTELAEHIDRMTAVELREVLTALGRPTSGRKASLVGRVVEVLVSADQLLMLFHQLTPLQQLAVIDAVHHPAGEHDPRAFRARHGAKLDWTGHRRRHEADPTPRRLLRLVFCDTTSAWERRGRSIPHELRERLRSIVPSPEPLVLDTHDAPPATYEMRLPSWSRSGPIELDVGIVETEAMALSEIAGVLQLAATGKLTVGEKTGRPAAAAIRAVSGILCGGDLYLGGDLPADWASYEWDPEDIGPIRAFAWPTLLHAGGLAKPFGRSLRLTPAGRAALAAPSADTIRDIWHGWIASDAIDELRRIDCIKGQNGKGRRHLTAPSSRRPAIAEALAGCPVDEWVTLDGLLDDMVANGAGFEVVRNDPWHLYVGCSPEYGSLGYDGSHDWHILQARYVLAALLEYVATLGMIDIGIVPPHDARHDHSLWGTDDLPFLSRYDGLVCLRVTPLGAWCLGMVESYAPSRHAGAGFLEVLPSRRVLTSPGAVLTHADRLVLDTIATDIGDADQPAWALDCTKLVAAAELGHAPDTVRQFLQDRCDQPLPPTVESLLVDADTRSRALRSCGEAMLFECTEEQIAEQLTHGTGAKLGALRAGTRHVVVPARRVDRFRQLAHQLGYGFLGGRGDTVA